MDEPPNREPEPGSRSPEGAGDGQLFVRIRDGDSTAFVALFRRYHDPLCVFAGRMLSDAEEAQDTVVDVFARIWESRAELELEATPKAYLYRSVRNGALDRLRRRRVREKAATRAALEGIRPGMGTATPSPAEDLSARELADRIREAIERLPRRCRETFLYHRWDGLTYAEIAEVMGVSVRTVENQVARALRLLRESLSDRV